MPRCAAPRSGRRRRVRGRRGSCPVVGAHRGHGRRASSPPGTRPGGRRGSRPDRRASVAKTWSSIAAGSRAQQPFRHRCGLREQHPRPVAQRRAAAHALELVERRNDVEHGQPVDHARGGRAPSGSRPGRRGRARPPRSVVTEARHRRPRPARPPGGTRRRPPSAQAGEPGIEHQRFSLRLPPCQSCTTPTSSSATPSARSCGSSRRLRLSSAKPGKRASATTCPTSSAASPGRGA